MAASPSASALKQKKAMIPGPEELPVRIAASYHTLSTGAVMSGFEKVAARLVRRLEELGLKVQITAAA
jgi:hypothetical protein